jgi:hypothetical protein
MASRIMDKEKCPLKCGLKGERKNSEQIEMNPES